MKTLAEINNWQEMIGQVVNADCLEAMRLIPDKSIDLVLTDPPYGLGDRLLSGGGKMTNTPMKILYRDSDWEDVLPDKKIFNELFRISKNQIICGGNYFELPPTRCIIAWDKKQLMPTFSQWEYIWTSFDRPGKIMRYSSMDLNRTHPTQKPIGLMEELILKFSEENDLVLDCFLGSGTTAVACKKLNCRFIGIEISPEYCAIAEQRLKQGVLNF